MTIKLFWKDPYQTECTAKVTEINGNTIKVDQTIFYAFSGGQESDDGTINGIKVIEAKKQGDKEAIIDIEYTLETEPNFKVGDEVIIKIDGEKRDKLRRLHTAAHLLYYITIDVLGEVRIKGSNVAPHKARMDFEYEESLAETLPVIEEKLNKFIEENHAVIMQDDPDKPDLRWWTCENWKMPCGGTHTKTSGEIGKLKLKTITKGKGRKRIEVYLT